MQLQKSIYFLTVRTYMSCIPIYPLTVHNYMVGVSFKILASKSFICCCSCHAVVQVIQAKTMPQFTSLREGKWFENAAPFLTSVKLGNWVENAAYFEDHFPHLCEVR